MLRTKIRFASLTAVVLLTLVAVYPSISFLRIDAQEPSKAAEKGPKIKDLQKEWLASVREMTKQDIARVKSGSGLVDEVLESTRMLADAELDVCETDKERVTALENTLATARETEGIATSLAKSGQGRESSALKATAERLRFQIALERAKAKAGATAAGKKSHTGADAQRRATTQPANIQAYESARVLARVSGYIKTQTVDLGDRVRRDQVLAVLHVPELEAQVKHDAAAVNESRARLQQEKARFSAAQADLEALKLSVKQAEEAASSAASTVRYRAAQLKRMEELLKNKAIDVHVLDEAKEGHEAAVEAEKSAKTAVDAAKARVAAGLAKIEEAKAGILVLEAGVMSAQATLEKSQVQLSFATIRAPFDGVISQRSHSSGEFVRSADHGGGASLFTVQRTDLLRVVVSIPERDVSFVAVGDAAEVEMDAVPGKKLAAKISRMAASLDPKTRTMAVEIDLPNPTGLLLPGMFGKVSFAPTNR